MKTFLVLLLLMASGAVSGKYYQIEFIPNALQIMGPLEVNGEEIEDGYIDLLLHDHSLTGQYGVNTSMGGLGYQDGEQQPLEPGQFYDEIIYGEMFSPSFSIDGFPQYLLPIVNFHPETAVFPLPSNFWNELSSFTHFSTDCQSFAYTCWGEGANLFTNTAFAANGELVLDDGRYLYFDYWLYTGFDMDLGDYNPNGLTTGQIHALLMSADFADASLFHNSFIYFMVCDGAKSDCTSYRYHTEIEATGWANVTQVPTPWTIALLLPFLVLIRRRFK